MIRIHHYIIVYQFKIIKISALCNELERDNIRNETIAGIRFSNARRILMKFVHSPRTILRKTRIHSTVLTITILLLS